MRTARWSRFLPRFLQPKYFVLRFHSLPPSILPMELWRAFGKPDEERVVARDVTYEEATAIAVLLPMGDRYDG